MLEQTVVKHDDSRDRAVRKAMRIIQIVLIALVVLAYVLGISLFSAFWDVDRTMFWSGVLTLLLFTAPVLPVLALLEWRIRLLCVEYDYVLSDNTFSVWRISGNRRALYLSFDLNGLTFCKAYDSLSESELGKMKKALFACCNASDPRLTLLEADGVQVRKQVRDAAILIEPNEEIARVLSGALRRNGR